MDFVIVGAIAVIEALLALGAMYFIVARQAQSVTGALDDVVAAVKEREDLRDRVRGLLEAMVDPKEIGRKVKEFRTMRETLKTERGRVTITQAELETVEGRLRELEEIERELEACGVETKEELNILEKKEKELSAKNDALKSQISASSQQIDQLLSELQFSAEAQERVQAMKIELLQTQEKIDTLLFEIEQGNDQYFILKKRYDALDIEYAQLFEKFSEAEGGGGD